MCCTRLAGNAGPKKIAKNSPFGHHRTTLSGYIFATKAHIDNRKNLLNSNVSPACPQNMAKFGPLAAEIVSLVWGIPANFNGFRVLAALLHGTLLVGVSQTLRRWTEGATYIRQGGHHVGRWPTFWFFIFLCDATKSALMSKKCHPWEMLFFLSMGHGVPDGPDRISFWLNN